MERCDYRDEKMEVQCILSAHHLGDHEVAYRPGKADLTETLAAMRDRRGETSRDITLDRDALLSAVENVLALRERIEGGVQPAGNAHAAGYNRALQDVRNALTDALKEAT